jgi:GNAT superfamily N-acetyltransferase
MVRGQASRLRSIRGLREPRPDEAQASTERHKPDQQGKGLGDKLLDHAEGIARSLGFDEIQLYTNAAFASNLSFYSRRGYQEHRRGMVVPGGVTVFMRKRIKVSG